MKRGSEFRKSTCYDLIFQLGLHDMLQLVAHFNGGLMALLGWTYADMINMLLGDMLLGCWFAMIWLIMIIAVNRLVVVTQFKYADAMFSSNLVKVYVSIAWLIPLMFMVTTAVDFKLVVFAYDLDYLAWTYGYGDGYTDLMARIDFYYSNLMPILALVVYGGLFIWLRNKHTMVGDVSNSAQRRKRELNLAAQATIITGDLVISQCFWHAAFTFEIFDGSDPAIGYICQLVWVLVNCVNPFIYIIFNQLMDNWHVISGFTNTVIGGVSMIVYVAILYEVKRGSEFKNVCYDLLFHLGLHDIVQLVVHFNGGIMGWAQMLYPDIVVEVLGAFLVGSWVSMIWMVFVVAVNRLSVITNFKYNHLLFHKHMFYILLSWLVVAFCLVSAVFGLELVVFIYDVTSFAWTYGYGRGDTDTFAEIEFYAANITVILASMAYVTLYVWLRQKHTGSGDVASNAERKKRELSLAAQATIITTDIVLVECVWHAAFTFQILDASVPLVGYICQMMWVVCNCVNPFIYLIFNRTLRKAVFKRFRLAKKTASVSVSGAPTGNQSTRF